MIDQIKKIMEIFSVNYFMHIHCFRPEDVMKAMESCRGKMFLGLEMDISLYEGKWYG